METTKRTTITATDPAFPDGVELPWEPDPYAPVVIEDGVIRYLVHDEFGGDHEFPDGVEFIQANSRYIHYCNDVDEWLERVNEDDSLTVFPVGVYEHGAIQYSLAGESMHSNDPWDYCVGACIAIPNDFTDPKEAARAILKEYTAWCNGEVYLIVTVPIDNPDDYDVCGGFIGDYAEEALKSGDF